METGWTDFRFRSRAGRRVADLPKPDKVHAATVLEDCWLGATYCRYNFMMRQSRGASALMWGFVVSFFSAAILAGAAQAQGPAARNVSSRNVPAPVQEQSSAPSIPPTAVASVLEEGQTLETQRRWAEAFQLYEDTIRQFGGATQPELNQRLDVAKMHFDIGRRYADSRFRRDAASMKDVDALDLYTDAATKLESHYVQKPDWQALVTRGTNDLEIALAETPFLENNVGPVNSDRIDLFMRELRKQQREHPVRTLNDARTAVWNAALLAKLHLAMRPAAVLLEYTAGMLGGLDEYSAFLTSGQLSDLYSQIEGNFVGLGVELKAQDGALLIVNVIHGSPAERSGIKPGDKIVSVGNQSTKELSTDKAAEMLQGAEGSVVDLSVVTGENAARRVRVTRQHVEVPSVDDVKIVDRDFGVGYFKLSCFQKTTSSDVDTALWQLQRDGMRSLIIDLRGNPGGLLTSGVEVADKFIDQGGIVSTRGRSPGEDYNYSAHSAGTWKVPLVVLIDGDSASAAEILAGALRDHKRATIVGTKSYGKGSVQGIFPLTVGGAGVRLTTAKFYSPNGSAFSHIGVSPEVKVQTVAKPIDGRITFPVSTGAADDPFISAGIQAAKQLVVR